MSLCEMMAFAKPPETVKVTFGLYLNYYLDEEKTSSIFGIVDYQHVKVHISGDAHRFHKNNDHLLKQLEEGEFENLEPRLLKLCIAIAYNIEKYELCVQNAHKASDAAGKIIKMMQYLAQFYFTFIFQKEKDEMTKDQIEAVN